MKGSTENQNKRFHTEQQKTKLALQNIHERLAVELRGI